MKPPRFWTVLWTMAFVLYSKECNELIVDIRRKEYARGRIDGIIEGRQAQAKLQKHERRQRRWTWR